MFVDSAEIYIKAGKGGDGAVSFRREKYIPNGGPDGGDGGNGGNIIIKVDPSCHGLADYNTKKNFFAQNGQNGMGANKHGKNGDDLILRMPPGTQMYNRGELLNDLTSPEDEFIIAKGGNGGWGNQHFASSIKQAPKWSKAGLKGESFKLTLELKTIADIGLIGMPNAGKSTMLSILSNARPKIADYPFTTLEPSLGVLKGSDVNIIIADIPGLIEGASSGKGLGDKFLKHIERTKALLHIVDISSEDPFSDYKKIRKELKQYSSDLFAKKELIVLNKIEIVDEKVIKKVLSKFNKKELNPILVSLSTTQNIDILKKEILRTINTI